MQFDVWRFDWESRHLAASTPPPPSAAA